MAHPHSLLQYLQRLQDKHKTHVAMGRALGVGRNAIRNYLENLHGLSWRVCSRLSNEIDEPIDHVLRAAGYDAMASALVARFGQPLLTEKERQLIDALRQSDPANKAAVTQLALSKKPHGARRKR